MWECVGICGSVCVNVDVGVCVCVRVDVGGVVIGVNGDVILQNVTVCDRCEHAV